MTGAIDMGNNLIQNVSDPVDPQDAINKQTMESALNLYLPLSGGTMSGNISCANTQTVSNLAQPVSDNDAATKIYVDNLTSSVHFKTPCFINNLAGDLNGQYTYTPGLNPLFPGVGAKLTGNTLFIMSFNGVFPVINDRVLIRLGTDQTVRGVYTVSQVGDGVGIFPELIRSTDFDGSPSFEVSPGAVVAVTSGPQADSLYILSNSGTLPNGYFDIGTDPLVFT